MNYIEGRFTGYTTNSYESLADYNAKIVAVKGPRSQVLGAADHYYLKQFPQLGDTLMECQNQTVNHTPPFFG